MIIRPGQRIILFALFVAGPLLGFIFGSTAGVYFVSSEQAVVESPATTTYKNITDQQVALPSGQSVALSELAPNRMTAIVVMKDLHCQTCQRQLHALSQRLHEAQLTGGAVFGLSNATPQQNARLMHRMGLSFPILSDQDGQLLRSFSMDLPRRSYVMPGVIFLNKDGQVDRVFQGRTPGTPQEDMIIDRLR